MVSSKPYRITSDKFPGLAKLVEECGEVVKDGAKIMGGCDSPEMIEHLELEMGDVFAALSFFIQHNNSDRSRVAIRRKEKQDRWNIKRARAEMRCGV